MATKTEILKVKGDWQEVVSDCRTTVSKPPLGKEPSAEFKRGMMICEHISTKIVGEYDKANPRTEIVVEEIAE